jgi:hypothetical protein
MSTLKAVRQHNSRRPHTKAGVTVNEHGQISRRTPMKKYCLGVALMVVAAAVLGVSQSLVQADAPEHAQPMLVHDVYFSLKDNSPQATQTLIAACKKYLTNHPGTVWFGVGPIAKEMRRDVNDRDFDVALHLVFKNKAAHDQYSRAERHLKFVEETQDSWKKVRVFDSYVEE